MLLCAQLIQILNAIPSEQRLCEHLEHNLLLRWLLGLPVSHRCFILPASPRTIAILERTMQVAAPSLIKCDIEGVENKSLAGAMPTLEPQVPIGFLATHGDSVHRRRCTILGELGCRRMSLDERPLTETSELRALLELRVSRQPKN